MQLDDIVICDPIRTPIGGFGGLLKSKSAADLGTIALKALIQRTDLPVSDVNDVILANCYPSMDAPAIGRVIALNAGLKTGAGGIQIDRRCGSGLQAIIYAVMQAATGGGDLIIAGGTESMSNAPYYTHEGRWGLAGKSGLMLDDSLAKGRVSAGGTHHPVPGGMIETAENLRRDYGISREAQDAFAKSSQEKTAAAVKRGAFDDEITPVTIKTRKDTLTVKHDEHPRPETTLEKLAMLRPIMASSDPDATVTAGNASGQNDGAALCIVTTRKKANALGLKTRLQLVSWAIAGVAPSHMGIGPVPAVKDALARADLTLSDIDIIELNEAFATQVLACTNELNFSEGDFERLNINGSGIALGHPVGATGARIFATLAYEMKRRNCQYGLETMCIGGGQGLAAIFKSASE